jgi:hypothetical protein
MNTILSLSQGLLLCVFWGIGGWLISRSAFHSARIEQIPLALITGFTLDTLFANMLAQLLPVEIAFWLAAVFVLLVGVALSWGMPLRDLFHRSLLSWQWLLLVGFTAIFTMAERGLAIFDDYAFLPTLSVIASGDIPPHFPLNAKVMFSYHYFLMIFAAQLTRIAGLEIWKSLDVSRAFSFTISMMLVGVWVLRLTRSRTAGVLGALFVSLAMGTRWILLLFPPPLINWISQSVTLIGSGSQSADTLAVALSQPWGVEGVGPVAFPFAFSNGIYSPAVLAMSGPNGTISTAITMLFLLTFNRWRGWRGMLVSGLLTASSALLTEFGLLMGLLSWGGITLIYLIQHKTIRLPRGLWQWLLVIGLGNLLGAFQGGAFTDIVAGWFAELQGQTVSSYQTVGFSFSFDPVIVSSHLGVLSLFRPQQLIAAVCEIGPILLLLPLLAVWGIKSYRRQRWFETVLILAGFFSLATVFIQYTGSAGVRNTSRLYSFISLCGLYAVPLTWMWVSHRSERLKWLAALLAAILMFGGVVILSVKLTAIQRPVYSYFLSALDARMYDTYWNRLEPDALIFDPEQYRAPTVFGRASLGFDTWFTASPEWVALRNAPDPYKFKAAGFHYAYMDDRYWQEIGPAGQKSMGAACVRLVDELSDAQGNFRKLLDLEGCK